MGVMPANVGRVSNLLMSQVALGRLSKTNLELFQVQQQLSTGRAIHRVSDDAVKAATIGVLDDRIERAQQRQRNIAHARAALGDLDRALGEAMDGVLEAKEIASTQVGLGFGAADRAAQSVIVSQLMQGMLATANRESVAGHVFGGSQPGTRPVVEFRGGYRFVSSGDGIRTDIGLGGGVPITLGSGSGVGATSARVRGAVDFNPGATAATRLADLDGARSLGVSLGEIEFSVGGGARVKLDLSEADTLGDIADAVEAAIRQYEADNSVTVLGPGGVSIGVNGLVFDMAAGPGPTLEFFDIGAGVTAQDLGLAGLTLQDGGVEAGLDVRPRLTLSTPIAALQGVAPPLGQIRVNNAGGTAIVDLSAATTLEDVKNAIEATNLGVRVVINQSGTGIDVVNEVSGGRSLAMSIEEISGNGLTATKLGIRTFAASTLITDFNDGRGVSIVANAIDPITGLPSPALDVDFEIVLGDAANTRISVDLRPQDMVTVQTVLDRINSQAAAGLTAAGLAPGDLVAELADGGNGFVLRQNAGFPGAVRVEAKNNSQAAKMLGLLEGSWDGPASSLRGIDTAKVRVDNVFSHLADLRDSLANNDTVGIALAGEAIERSVGTLTEVRGLVGGYARRVDFAERLEEDQETMDLTIRSELRDVDFAAAASRLGLLQTQLEAGYRTSSSTLQLTLLDFLR